MRRVQNVVGRPCSGGTADIFMKATREARPTPLSDGSETRAALSYTRDARRGDAGAPRWTTVRLLFFLSIGPPTMDKQNPQTSHGVFKPVDHVVISFPSAEDQASAVQALAGIGCRRGDHALHAR